jgi:hypothetical protein
MQDRYVLGEGKISRDGLASICIDPYDRWVQIFFGEAMPRLPRHGATVRLVLERVNPARTTKDKED